MEAKSSNALRVLIRAQFANALGDGGFIATSTLYFTFVVGLSPAQVGAGLSLAWIVGFLFSTPVGVLADRAGLRGSAMVLAMVTAFGLVLLIMAESFATFMLAATVYAVGQSCLAGTRQALLVVLIDDEQRVAARARLQVALNAGLAIGAVGGALALAVGTATAFRVVLGVDTVFFVVAAAALARVPAPTKPALGTISSPGASVLRDGRYLLATVLNAVLYLYMPVMSVLLPLWIAEHTAAPEWFIGALFVINTVGVVALQRPIAARVRGLASAARSVRRSAVLLAVACLALGASAFGTSEAVSLAALSVGAVLLVLGEMHLAAGSWSIGFELADAERPGQWQSMYASGQPIARALGPIVLLGVVFGWAYLGWVALGGLFLAAGLGLAMVAHRSRVGDAGGLLGELPERALSAAVPGEFRR